jgi:glycine C-acetyltransferase
MRRFNNGFSKKKELSRRHKERKLRFQLGNSVEFCSNNYLGLSSHPEDKSRERHVDSHGFGMSSVRFICGTQDIHKTLRENSRILRNGRHYSLRCGI